MSHASIVLVSAAVLLAGINAAASQPFPSSGSPDPAMTAPPTPGVPTAPGPVTTPAPNPTPTGGQPTGSVPRAVTVARTTAIPRCAVFVDAAAPAGRAEGSAQKPHHTIAAAVAAAQPGAVICVAEGTYPERLTPGEKHFTLAGGFQRGREFKVRDSATYVSKATGRGGSFFRSEDPGPKGDQLTVIDGFEISGYSQAIYRDIYYSQKFEVTNNHIHDNRCATPELVGAGFALNNVSGRIEGNVFRNNSCRRGGAGFLNDSTDGNTVGIERNLIEGNAGTEPDNNAHGGGLYLFGKSIRITSNEFRRNTVTGWGAGLYIGADPPGGQHTNATLNWNIYRDNRAGIAGGGLFCDDGASCTSFHEVYDRNCGGNIYLDSGSGGAPTTARFDHLTNVGALEVGCRGPGPGVRIDHDGDAPDAYSFVDAVFWNNAAGQDFAGSCNGPCRNVRVNVSYSMVQTRYLNNGMAVVFGEEIVTSSDPLFADPAAGDFHLKSTIGRWTPAGYVTDAASSPALGKGNPRGTFEQNPPRAGSRIELGAYGNSAEASYVR